MKMNSVTLKSQVERSSVVEQSHVSSKFAFLQKGTIAFLLLSSIVSLYEGFFVVGMGSTFFIPFLAGGLGRLVVTRFCWKGSRVSFVTSTVFALSNSATDIAFSGGDYLNGALYVLPQLMVVVFSILALRQMKKS
jgi:hypothetical protein